MGLRNFLKGLANPTELWREDVTIPLVVDLDMNLFCGVRPGDAAARLGFLGPGSTEPMPYSWPHRGVYAGVEEDRVHETAVFFGHAEEPDCGEFMGTVRWRGVPAPLSRTTTEARIVETFGEPYWRDQDDDEVILFYEFAAIEWQLEFGSDGCLKCLRIGEPLLADPQQRQSYGVTKPWPY